MKSTPHHHAAPPVDVCGCIPGAACTARSRALSSCVRAHVYGGASEGIAAWAR